MAGDVSALSGSIPHGGPLPPSRRSPALVGRRLSCISHVVELVDCARPFVPDTWVHWSATLGWLTFVVCLQAVLSLVNVPCFAAGVVRRRHCLRRVLARVLLAWHRPSPRVGPSGRRRVGGRLLRRRAGRCAPRRGLGLESRARAGALASRRTRLATFIRFLGWIGVPTKRRSSLPTGSWLESFIRT